MSNFKIGLLSRVSYMWRARVGARVSARVSRVGARVGAYRRATNQGDAPTIKRGRNPKETRRRQKAQPNQIGKDASR